MIGIIDVETAAAECLGLHMAGLRNKAIGWETPGGRGIMAYGRRAAKPALLLILVALLCGCGSSKPADSADKGPTFRIALILPSVREDLAWSEGMYLGVRAAQEELGQDRIEVALEEDLPSPGDAAASMDYYARQGFNLIIAHGSQYRDTVIELAATYPDACFAYGPGSDTTGNVFAYDPQAQQGGYLLGTLAGLMTRSNKIGLVGTVESEESVKYVRGFLLGVKSANADAEVLKGYTGSFGNTAAAVALANQYADNGVDLLTGTALRSKGAVQVAANRGLPWLASDMGQPTGWPEAVVAGQVIRWKEVAVYLCEACTGATKRGGYLPLTFGNGWLSLVYGDVLAIPDDVRSAVQVKLEAIVGGSLVVE